LSDRPPNLRGRHGAEIDAALRFDLALGAGDVIEGWDKAGGGGGQTSPRHVKEIFLMFNLA